MGYLRAVAVKPDCGPKEAKMGKKQWMWDGQEMNESEHGGLWSLYSRQIAGGRAEVLTLHAASRSELYDAASKAGCVEVAKPESKDPSIDSKRWMWNGVEGEEFHAELCSYILFGQELAYHKPMLFVRAATIEQTRKLARQAGCVEVVLPVRCVCGGKASPNCQEIGANHYAVRCESKDCYMLGPARLSKKEAFAAWNGMMRLCAARMSAERAS